MKLIEIKNKTQHYFRDEQGLYQGEFKLWWSNGQQATMRHYRDGKLHGEGKYWYENGQRSEAGNYRNDWLHGEYKWWNSAGELRVHTFDVNGEEIIDFLENPELYPTTPEEKTMFVLKYGNAPLLST